MEGISQAQLLALEEAVQADAGAACFPALAEAHRRAGLLAEAERIVRSGLDRNPDAADGRLVLGFVLLDQGRTEEARLELESLTAGVLASHGISLPPGPGASPPAADPDAEASISDAELDDAFGQAETDTDELIDPNRVAAAAVAHLEATADDDIDEMPLADALEPGSAFATATMAGLLEQQGDETGAERIRAALEPAAASATPEVAAETLGGSAVLDEHPASRPDLIGTLERWLTNLRGDRP